MAEVTGEYFLSWVTRPNGRTYKPRKLRVIDWDDGINCSALCVIVLGTHDLALAREAAHQEHPDAELDLGRRGWWRQAIRRGEEYWEWDDVRGAAGVMFEEDTAPPVR
jgi:hypothetical protein